MCGKSPRLAHQALTVGSHLASDLFICKMGLCHCRCPEFT